MLLNESVLAFIFLLINIFHGVEGSGQAPVFFNPSSPKTETLSENTSPGQSVFVVIGTDYEGDTLTYSIHNQSPSTPSFSLDSSTGELTSPSGLDAETTTTFTLDFKVTDGTSTVTSPMLTVNIQDVNESPPVFNQTSYTATIYDTVTNGASVLTVFASDPDVTASITYSITAGDTTTFSIGPLTGDITVSTAGNLNPSTTPSYSLTVQVSDGSFTDTASVSVTVLDDPCCPNPCQNSSTCSQSGSAYTCTGQSGWLDSNCSTDVTCYSCDDLSYVELCDVVKHCDVNEVCYLKSYMKFGRKLYRSGCMQTNICLQKMDFYKTLTDKCVECCTQDYCNHKGCGDKGLIPRNQRGPLCYDCHYERSPVDCNKLSLCEQNEFCSIEEIKWGDHSHFIMGCSDEQCPRTSRSVHFATRALPVCRSCCADDYCNLNCTRSDVGSVLVGKRRRNCHDMLK